MSLDFNFSIDAHSISKEVVVFFSFMVSLRKNLCLLSLIIIDVHVILSNKILDHCWSPFCPHFWVKYCTY